MDWIGDPQAWIGLLTLAALEIVLGIDNIVFISILAGKLPALQQAKARRLGLGKAGANGHTPPRLPRFAFYMKLVPGPHQKAGQKGTEAVITPPTLHLPDEVTSEYLSAAYVGRERLVELQQLYHDATDWAQAWDRLPGPARNGSGPDEAESVE